LPVHSDGIAAEGVLKTQIMAWGRLKGEKGKEAILGRDVKKQPTEE